MSIGQIMNYSPLVEMIVCVILTVFNCANLLRHPAKRRLYSAFATVFFGIGTLYWLFEVAAAPRIVPFVLFFLDVVVLGLGLLTWGFTTLRKKRVAQPTRGRE